MIEPIPGRITRVRMEAEAGDLVEVQRALNAAFGVIAEGVIRSIESSGGNASGATFTFTSSGLSGPFPRESTFIEEVYESKIATHSTPDHAEGTVYFVGRRVVQFEVPVEGFPLEDFGTAMMTGTLLDENGRIARLELDATVASVSVERLENGIWRVSAVRSSEVGFEGPLPVSPTVGHGGTLSKALTEVEDQVFPDVVIEVVAPRQG